ncbi:hypothetical protein TNCV_1297891 [Trichonephila clavipes]|nr:hypothetical protein TNCV_1297891 [Trichonephila clavipes]
METQYSNLLLHYKVRWRSKELKGKLEELEVQKYMYVTQQNLTALKEMPRVVALTSLPDCYIEVKKLAFGVLRLSLDQHIRAGKHSLALI